MPSPEPEFCLSRLEVALFEPMHGYRDRPEISDLTDDIEIFELASPADHDAIDA